MILHADNFMFKVNNRNIRTKCGVCSKLTLKALERCLRIVLVSRLFVKFKPCSTVSIIKFEQVNK